MLTTATEAHRPVAVARVGMVEGPDGLVLVSPGGDVAELDAPARLLWKLFDGEVTLGELADDIVAVFEGTDRDAVLGDLGRLVADLEGHGLVQDATSPPTTPEGAPTESVPADRLAAPRSCCGNRLGEEPWRPDHGVSHRWADRRRPHPARPARCRHPRPPGAGPGR